MAWYWWVIIIIILIAGILMSVWWAISVFDLNSQSQSWTQRLKKKPKFGFNDSLEPLTNQSGIMLMVVGDQWTDADQFWPFYLFASANLNEAISAWKQKINHDYHHQHSSPIVDYLNSINQTPDQISFYLLKKINDQKSLTKQATTMIDRYKLTNHSFNQKNNG